MVRRSSHSPLGAANALGPCGDGVVLDDEVRGFVRTLSVSLARGDLSLADDIEQETLLVALQRCPESPGALRGWLRSVARFSQRSVLGRARRHGNHVYYDAALHDGAVRNVGGAGAHSPGGSLGTDPSELGVRNEVGAALERALGRLPERYGSVVRMRVLDGMPPRAIAAEMDVPVNTVRTWTRRAFDQLREDADCAAMDQADRSRFGALGAGLLRFLRSRAFWAAVVPATVAGVVLLVRGEGERAVPGATDGPKLASFQPDSAAMQGLGQGATRSALDPELPVIELPEATAISKAPSPATLLVTVLDEAGLPAPGIELYLQTGRNGSVRRAGVTGAEGTLRIPKGSAATQGLGGTARRLAARGGVGQLSESVLLGQPFVDQSDSLTLRLREVPFRWLDVDRSARPDLVGPLRIEGIPEDQRFLAQESPEGGIRGVSCWVPPWTDGAGRYGVTTGDLRKYLAVWSGEERVAVAGPFTVVGGVPESLALARPWSIKGQLVTSYGRPVPGARLRLGSGTNLSVRGPRGEGAHTDARGHFELRGLVGNSVSLEAQGLASRTIHRPDADSIDVGVVTLEEGARDIGIAGRVLGASGPFTIQVVTGDWRRAGVAIHLLGTRSPGDSVATDSAGEFRLDLAAKGVRSILVTSHPGGDVIPPTRFERPEGGWSRSGVQIRVDPRSVARLSGELSDSLAPGWVQFVNSATGHRLTGQFHDGGSSFRSPALGAGDWQVVAFDQSGQLCTLRTEAVEAGSQLDLGVLNPAMGELEVFWPAELDASRNLYLTVFRDGELWYQRQRTPLELRRDFSLMRLAAGSYSFEVRGQGVFFGAGSTVQDGERSTLLLERGRTSSSHSVPARAQRH